MKHKDLLKKLDSIKDDDEFKDYSKRNDLEITNADVERPKDLQYQELIDKNQVGSASKRNMRAIEEAYE